MMILRQWFYRRHNMLSDFFINFLFMKTVFAITAKTLSVDEMLTPRNMFCSSSNIILRKSYPAAKTISRYIARPGW